MNTKLAKFALLASALLLAGCGTTTASDAQTSQAADNTSAAASAAGTSAVTSAAGTSSAAAEVSTSTLPADAVSYRLTFKTTDGNYLSGLVVSVLDKKGNVVTCDTTNKGGYISFKASPADYVVEAELTGTDYEDYYGFKELVFDKTVQKQTFYAYTRIEKCAEGEGLSEDALDSTTTLQAMDQMVDFSYTTVDKNDDGTYTSTDHKFSDVFGDDYDVYVINFWGTYCSWCVKEMPYFNQMLSDEDYSRVKFICLDTYYDYYDTMEIVGDFKAENEYDLDLCYTASDETDVHNLNDAFGVSGWPSSAIVDRDGQIMAFESGALTSYDAVKSFVDPYMGTDEEYKANLEANYIVEWDA